MLHKFKDPLGTSAAKAAELIDYDTQYKLSYNSVIFTYYVKHT